MIRPFESKVWIAMWSNVSNPMYPITNSTSKVNTVGLKVKYFTQICLTYYTLTYPSASECSLWPLYVCIECEPINNYSHMYIAHLQVELCWECSVFHIADIILGKVQIGEVSKATEWGIMHRSYLVLVQPQVNNCTVERSMEALSLLAKKRSK